MILCTKANVDVVLPLPKAQRLDRNGSRVIVVQSRAPIDSGGGGGNEKMMPV